MTIIPKPPRRTDPGLQVIAVVKLVKGALLFGLGLGVVRMINRDAGEVVRKVAVNLRIDPENRIVQYLLEKLTDIPPRVLRNFGIISLFYSADLVAEGIGLWLNQAWAKYLLLVATGLFVPEEAYALGRHFTWVRLLLLAVNIAVFAYVAQFLCRQHPGPRTPSDRLEGQRP